MHRVHERSAVKNLVSTYVGMLCPGRFILVESVSSRGFLSSTSSAITCGNHATLHKAESKLTFYTVHRKEDKEKLQKHISNYSFFNQQGRGKKVCHLKYGVSIHNSFIQ